MANSEDNRPMINWTRPKLEAFKRALKKAPGDRNQVFVFEGNEFVKSYAGFLIEFLESQLPKN